MDGCKANANAGKWCYTCGSWIVSKSRHQSNAVPHSPEYCRAFQAYFNEPVRNQDQPWCPHVSCTTCYTVLMNWRNGQQASLGFKKPVQWSEPSHAIDSATSKTDCFFCNSVPPKLKAPARRHFCQSATAPIPRNSNESPPAPLGTQEGIIDAEMESQTESESDSEDERKRDPDWQVEQLDNVRFIDQAVLDSIILILKLDKTKAQTLGSILLHLGLLEPGTVIGQKNRSDKFVKYFDVKDVAVNVKIKGQKGQRERQTRSVAFCKDIEGLYRAFGQELVPDQWRLFLDGSNESFKAVLLHNEVDQAKRLPSVPIALANGLPEAYDSLEAVLQLVNYEKYQWLVQGDFKLINLISGMKNCSSKYPCYLCNFASSEKEKHYRKGQWRSWTAEDRRPGQFSFIAEALIPAERIVPPEMHIRHGLFQSFIKRLKQMHNEAPHPAYQYYIHKFRASHTEAKLEGGSLTGPEILSLVNDRGFSDALEQRKGWDLHCEELRAWYSFVFCVTHFFGKNDRLPDIEDRVGELMEAFEDMGVNMSLKIHFLADHFGAFPEHLGAWSEQHGERSHQEMKPAARLYPTTSTVQVMCERAHQLQPLPADLEHSKAGPSSQRFPSQSSQ